MQIVAAGCQDCSCAARATDRGASRRALSSTRDGANDRSNTCTATDHGCVAFLVVLGNTDKGPGFDFDGLSITLDRGQPKTQGRASLYSARLLHIHNAT